MLAVPCARNSTVGSSPPQACQLKLNSDQLRCRAAFFIGKNDNLLSWLFAGSLLCAFGITLSAFMPNLEVMFFTLGRRLTHHVLPCQPSCWALYPPTTCCPISHLVELSPTHHVLTCQQSSWALYPPTTCRPISQLVQRFTHLWRTAMSLILLSSIYIPTCHVHAAISAILLSSSSTVIPTCYTRILRYPPSELVSLPTCHIIL